MVSFHLRMSGYCKCSVPSKQRASLQLHSYGIHFQLVLIHSDSDSEAHLLEVIAQVRAKWDFSSKEEGELSFKFGDTINVVEYGKNMSLS